jgi:hypothetical protein
MVGAAVAVLWAPRRLGLPAEVAAELFTSFRLPTAPVRSTLPAEQEEARQDLPVHSPVAAAPAAVTEAPPEPPARMEPAGRRD